MANIGEDGESRSATKEGDEDEGATAPQATDLNDEGGDAVDEDDEDNEDFREAKDADRGHEQVRTRFRCVSVVNFSGLFDFKTFALSIEYPTVLHSFSDNIGIASQPRANYIACGVFGQHVDTQLCRLGMQSRRG